MRNKVILKSKKFLQVIFVIFLLAIAGYSQGEVKNSGGGGADKNLKSTGRVNPLTFAMEFSLPLASYPGRGGNSVPVVINYSSKLWQLEHTGNWSMTQSPTNANRLYYSDTRPKFAEWSTSGWTSSLMPPRIEIKEEFYDEEGEPWSFQNSVDLALIENNQSQTNLLPPGCFYSGGSVSVTWVGPDGHSYTYISRDYYCIDGGSGHTTWDDPDPTNGPGGGNPTNQPQVKNIKYIKRVHVYMPDGSSQEFRKDDSVYPYCTTALDSSYCNGAPTPTDLAGDFISTDGSRMRLTIGNSAQSESSYLYLPDGSKYTFPTNRMRGRDWYAAEYKDINGNKTLYEQTVASTGKLVGGIKDTLERPTIADPLLQNRRVVQETLIQEYHALGMGGNTTQDYTLKWEKLENVLDDPVNHPISYTGQSVCFIGGQNTMKTHNDGSQNDDPNTPDDDDGPILFNSEFQTRVCSSGINGRKFNPNVLASIIYPDGTSYGFKYNQYGEITEISYPTGGYEKFEYGKITPVGAEPSVVYGQTNRGVKKHWVYNDDGTLEGYRVFEQSGTSGQSGTDYAVTTTDRDGSKSVRYLYRPGSEELFGFSDPRNGMPYDEQTFDANGQLRQRKLTKWGYSGPLQGGAAEAKRDSRPEKEISIMIDGGQAIATMSETTYENPTSNQAASDPLYFAHLNAIRSKSYHYQVISTNLAATGTFDQVAAYFVNAAPSVVSETDYLYGSEGDTYKARGIIGLVKTTKALHPQTSEVLNKSEVKYDEQGQYYSMETGGTTVGYEEPTGTNPQLRGNVTTARTWVKETDTWLEAHTQSDKFGNLRKVWDITGDPNRFTETFYTGGNYDYKYAYPVKVVTPAPAAQGSPNGTDQTSKAEMSYDFTTGLPLEVKNDFNQVTKTEYDNFLRPIRVLPNVVNNVPTSPITETEYGVPYNGKLNSGQRFVKVKGQIDTTNWGEAISWFDGLGRSVKTQTKDSQGDVVTESKYDQMGRPYLVTNPYRVGDTNIYWHLTEFDELGRAKQSREPVLNQNPGNPSGSILGTTEYGISTAANYVGTFVMTTDAAGKKSRAITNGLGQLIRVDEPDYTGGLTPLPQSTPNPSPTPIPSGTPEIPPPGCTAECLTNTEYPSNATVYRYNEQGKMVEVIQGDQHRYFKYDSLGRLIRVRQPEQEINGSLDLADNYNTSGQWTARFVYDLLGNVISATDANGTVITNIYDKANRVITKTYSNEPNGQTTPAVEYFYDGTGLAQAPPTTNNYAKGKLTKVTSSVSETRYTLFDNLGRLTQMEQRTPVSGETLANATPRISSYQYNFAGALVKETYPSLREVNNEFEADGDLARIYGKANPSAIERTYANGFSYTADGKIQRLKLGNNRWESAKFNDRLQVTELALGTSDGDGSLWKLKYDYGELNTDGSVNTAKNTGNIAKQTLSFNGLTNPLVQTFKYDSLYRLTEARETNGTGTSALQTWKENFGYDRYGNRLSHDKFVGTTQLTLDNKTNPTIDPNNNRFNSGQGYVYDKNGNIIQDVGDQDAVRTFVFNGDNKQRFVVQAGKNVGEYFYDGEGHRVKKIVYDTNGTTVKEETIFVYSSGKLIEEYSTKAPPQNPTTSYTATDQLGSPRVITDSNGNVVSRRDFMPFGEEITNNIGERAAASLKYGVADGIRQKFTGYQKDDETGLDFAEARMYENRHGRFTAVDPLLASGKSANPQTFNRYVYVLNNPLRFIDPSGMQVATHKGDVWVSPDGKTFNTYQKEKNWAIYKGPTTVFVGNGSYWWEVKQGGWRRLGKFEGAPVEVRDEALPELIEMPDSKPQLENAIPNQGIEFLPGNNLSTTDQESIADTTTSMLSSPQCRQSFLDGGLRNPFSQKVYFGTVSQLTDGSPAKSLGLTEYGRDNAEGAYRTNFGNLNAVTQSNNRVWLNEPDAVPRTIDDNPRIFIDQGNYFGERYFLYSWRGIWSSRTNTSHEFQHGSGKPGIPGWFGHDLRYFNPTHNRIIDACSQ